jgi:hypothetical protein
MATRVIPEWRIAVICDASSDLVRTVMYPGGVFDLGVALGWVQQVETMFVTGWSTWRQAAAAVVGGRRLSRALGTLPSAEADRVLTGHPVPWYPRAGPHGPGDDYW